MLACVIALQVRPFIQQFRKLDVTGDGRLGRDDLKVLAIAATDKTSNVYI